MIKREIYGAYNVCIERLLEPPIAPRGDNSDFMKFGSVFDYERPIDLLDDFRELLIECFQFSLDETMSEAPGLAGIVSAAKYPFTLRRVLRGVVGEVLLRSPLRMPTSACEAMTMVDCRRSRASECPPLRAAEECWKISCRRERSMDRLPRNAVVCTMSSANAFIRTFIT